MPECLVDRLGHLGRFKPTATLVGIALAGFFQCGACGFKQAAVRDRNAIEVVPSHAVVACVVITAEEKYRLGNGQLTIIEQPANAGVVGHLCKSARIRSPPTSATRAAVVCGFVRVIETGGTMPTDDDEL